MTDIQYLGDGSFNVPDVDVGWMEPRGGGRGGGTTVARPPRRRAERTLATPADGFEFRGDGSFNPGHMHREDTVRHDSTNPSCCGGCGMGWGCDGSDGAKTAERGPRLTDGRAWDSEFEPEWGYGLWPICCDPYRCEMSPAGTLRKDVCQCPDGSEQAFGFDNCCPEPPQPPEKCWVCKKDGLKEQVETHDGVVAVDGRECVKIHHPCARGYEEWGNSRY